MIDVRSLTGDLLVAMPGLRDPNFEHTVTLVCQHNEDGALGLVINRPSDYRLGELLRHLDLSSDDDGLTGQPVLNGGPLQRERGFVLHPPDGHWASTHTIDAGLSLTTSRDILEAIGQGQGSKNILVALGYAGWGKGQLEREIVENSWLNAPASQSILFKQPAADRWKAAAELMGVDISLLTAQAGHG